LRPAGEAKLNSSALVEMGVRVEEALAGLEAAGYRVDVLVYPAIAEEEKAAAARLEESKAKAEPRYGGGRRIGRTGWGLLR
jgi:hypothetical protein